MLVKPEPTRGLEPRTYRLQDSPSTLTTAATSDFTVYSDRFGDYSGASGREFVSQVVSRRHADAVISARFRSSGSAHPPTLHEHVIRQRNCEDRRVPPEVLI